MRRESCASEFQESRRLRKRKRARERIERERERDSRGRGSIERFEIKVPRD